MKLRVEFQDAAKAIMIRVEGRIVGRFARELQDFVASCRLPLRVIVNLSDVSLIDSVGEDVLWWFKSIGVTFIADRSYPRAVCERLHLPLLRRLSWAVQKQGIGRARALPGDVVRA